MKKPLKETKKPLSTKELMTILVSQYLDQCIQCKKCLNICPVTKGDFTIDELNYATEQGVDVPPSVKDFAFNCVQCGKCVPVCPMKIRRDYMMRYLKFKLKAEKPWGYSRYLLIKGPNRKIFNDFVQSLYIYFKKITVSDLAAYMETMPKHNVDVLFYPGCYVYSTKTTAQTIRLLKYIGCSYAVLGGVTTCCGAPHLLQGEFDDADQCLASLHQKIKKVNPAMVITGCAECYEAIERIKTTYHEDFELFSVAQYLNKNRGKFPIIKHRGTMALHDSCRFAKDSAHGVAARYAVARFGELKETPSGKQSPCCYQWNHGHDPENSKRRMQYLKEIKKKAPTLVCSCLTCAEELQKNRCGVEVIDIVQLYDESLNTTSKRKD
jgi:heterodisulfide reductase subunit D